MKLFEIDQNLRELWNKIAEQEGEVLPEDEKALEELELARDDKLKGYGIIIRELDNDIAECKAETDRIKTISDRLKSRREWLINRLKYFMQSQNLSEYKSVEVNIFFRKSKSLEIDENANLPKTFIKIKEEPDKKAITDFIKKGGTVDGCQLVEKENIQVK